MKLLQRLPVLAIVLIALNGCLFNEKGDVIHVSIPEDGVYERNIDMSLDGPTDEIPHWREQLVPIGPGWVLLDAKNETVSIRVTECVSERCEDIGGPVSSILARLNSEGGMSFTIERKVVVVDAQRYGSLSVLALMWGTDRLLPTAEALDAEWMEAQ